MTHTIDFVKKFRQILNENGLDRVQIMPLTVGQKNPIRKHRGGVYDENSVIYDPNTWFDKGQRLNCGLLMNDQIFCIDLDGHGSSVEAKMESANKYFEHFRSQYDLKGAWIEKTRKGYHIIFKKPVDMEQITLATDAFKHIDMPGIDLVTQTNSYHDNVPTNAILAVYPSKNKEWIDGHNPLKGHPLDYPPDELKNWITSNYPTRSTKSESKNVTKTYSTSEPNPAPSGYVAGHGTKEEIKQLKEILLALPAKYYEDTGNGGNWQLWFRVMLGIQYLMGSDGYDTWDSFNRRAQCYTDEMASSNRVRYWDKNLGKDSDKPITMGSFSHWCRIDAPEAWKEIKQKSLFKYRLDCVGKGYFELAKLAFHELDDIYHDHVTNSWIKFTDGVWDLKYKNIFTDLNEIVRVNFERDMIKHFRRELDELKNKRKILTVEEYDENKDKIDEQIKKATDQFDEDVKKTGKVCMKFSNTPNKITDQMKGMYHVDWKFDDNPWLVGIKGGYVYDLKNCLLRPAVKEDYVSLALNVTAQELKNVSEEETNELVNFINTILPYKDAREYQFYLLALALNGISAKKFVCQNGSGSNGKSTLFDLMLEVFGDYGCAADTSLFTQKLDTRGAKPELLDLKNARLILATEPEENESFHAGAIKNLTGGDSISCRGMYWNDTITFLVKAQINLLCNVRPSLKGMDGGLKRRLLNILFPAEFVNNPDPANPLQKQKDAKFSNKEWIRKMIPAMLKYLLSLHDQYVQQGLDEYQLDPPDSIVERTNDWYSSNDPLKHFLEEVYLNGCRPDKNGFKIKVKDIMIGIKDSNWFKRLSSTQQRQNTRKKLLDQFLSTNPQWADVYTSSKKGSYFIMSLVDTEDETTPEMNELLL